MSMTFNGSTKRITLGAGVTALSVRELWSRSCDWLAEADNAKFGEIMSQVGGDVTKIPIYIFLENGWRVIPQSADHALTVFDGVLDVRGGGDPFVDPEGAYKIRIRLQEPGIAIGYSTTGGSGGTPSEVASAVRNEIGAELLRIVELAALHGLVPSVPLVVTPTSRQAGAVTQNISQVGDVVTVSRTA